MSKNRFKSLAVILLIVILFSIAGCEKNNSIYKVDIHDDMIFQAKDLKFEGIKGDMISIFAQNERIYLSTSLYLYSSYVDGSDLKKISYPNMEEGQWIQTMAVDKDGLIIFLICGVDEITQKSIYFIVKIDQQGKELVREDISKWLNVSENSCINEILIDDKGRIIFIIDYSLYIIDKNGKVVDEMKSDICLQGLALTKNGKIICGINSEQTSQPQVISVDVEKEQ